MSLDSQILTLAVDHPEHFVSLQRLGISSEDFEEPYAKMWNFVLRTKRTTGHIPSRDVVARRFGDAAWARRTRATDLPVLVHELRERRNYNRFLEIMHSATRTCTEPELLPDVLAQLQSDLNQIALKNGGTSLVDVTSNSYRKELFSEIRRRRSEEVHGVSTGFPTLDAVTGGLQAGRLISVIARAGSYKTWLDLFFVAEAIMQEKKVILYPLEMTTFETMMRLYTIFSHKMFGGRNTFKNLDLSQGRINRKRFVQFLSVIEDKFNSQLLVADITKLDGEYTIERIEAEVEMHQPHMWWVDYLTLLRIPGRSADSSEWQGIKYLTRSLKGIASRTHTIGGTSAQVNREYIKSRAKLPRPEHISFGDSLAADADQVISLAKQNSNTILYGLPKNRHGPEIQQVVCKVDVNLGVIQEEQI